MKLVERILPLLIEGGHYEQLAALLIAAWDQLLVPSPKDGSFVDTSVGKYFAEKLRKQSDQLKDAQVFDPLQFQRKPKLMFAFNMVNTLWNCVDVLNNYRDSARAKVHTAHLVSSILSSYFIHPQLFQIWNFCF